MKDSGLYKKYIGSPCKQNDEKKKYQDSVQSLHKPAYKEYIKKRKEGYTEDNSEDSMPNQFIPPAKDQSKNKTLKDFAYAKEIGKGGSVTKDGVAASKLARKYK